MPNILSAMIRKLLRGNENSHVDERTLEEIYSRHFSQPYAPGCSICSAYNAVNGTWSSELPMLNTIIKGNWGFDGFMNADWGGNFAWKAPR